MDAVAVVLLASSIGVGFGWQPMPDGSPRVEYLVQIEPEMLATLQAGQTIPIVSEVPEGVGPIGRVRIVVGRGDLPRQNATTRFKPDANSDGVLQAQYVAPAATTAPVRPMIDPDTIAPRPRQPALSASQPIDNQPFGTTDPFAQALQDSAERIRRASQQVRESAGQIGGQRATGHDHASANDTNAAANTTADATEHSQPSSSVAPQFDPSRYGDSNANELPASRASDDTPRSQRLDVSIAPGQVGQWDNSPSIGYRPPEPTSTPAIRRSMLDQPTNVPLPVDSQPNDHFPIRTVKADSSATQASNSQRTADSPSGLSLDKPQPSPADNTPADQATDVSPAAAPVSPSGSNMFPLLLAWVLLSGSIAGNLYLFWSYLDVRGKYQAVVRSTRSLGNRYSGA